MLLRTTRICQPALNEFIISESKALRAMCRLVGMSPDAQRPPTLATALQSTPHNVRTRRMRLSYGSAAPQRTGRKATKDRGFNNLPLSTRMITGSNGLRVPLALGVMELDGRVVSRPRAALHVA